MFALKDAPVKICRTDPLAIGNAINLDPHRFYLCQQKHIRLYMSQVQTWFIQIMSRSIVRFGSQCWKHVCDPGPSTYILCCVYLVILCLSFFICKMGSD